MDDVVRTYAQQAIDRWMLTSVQMHRGNRQQPHEPSTCGCLVCSDGREVMGMRQPIPSWVRRSVPSFYRRRWR